MVDCKYAGEKSSHGQIWCTKKEVYVHEASCESCPLRET